MKIIGREAASNKTGRSKTLNPLPAQAQGVGEGLLEQHHDVEAGQPLSQGCAWWRKGDVAAAAAAAAAVAAPAGISRGAMIALADSSRGSQSAGIP